MRVDTNASGMSDRDARFHDQQRRFEDNGKTVVEFCRKEGVAISTFYQRRTRLNKLCEATQADQPSSSFIEVGGVAVVGLLAAARCRTIWTSSVLTPYDFVIALSGFVLRVSFLNHPLRVRTL